MITCATRMDKYAGVQEQGGGGRACGRSVCGLGGGEACRSGFATGALEFHADAHDAELVRMGAQRGMREWADQ